MRSKFDEHWKHTLGNSTKLKLYSEIKLSYIPEKYLNIIKSDKLKQAICSVRISNHILMIEKGRYQVPKLPRDLRISAQCVMMILKTKFTSFVTVHRMKFPDKRYTINSTRKKS